MKKEMTEVVQRRLHMAGELLSALANNQLELYYQPQYCLHSGKMDAVEALIRWRHPEKGMITQDQFLPVIEETGLVIPIGTWVLETACQQAHQWMESGTPISVVVNVSAKQFIDTNFYNILKVILDDTNLPPYLLAIEFTESWIIEDIENSFQTFQLLSDLGICLVIDGIGTEFSSRSYLTQLAVRKLKIDRSFLHDLFSKKANKHLISNIVSLAHSLRLKVISEGVETPEQLTFLKEINCDLAQGPFLGKAVSVECLEISATKPININEGVSEDECHI